MKGQGKPARITLSVVDQENVELFFRVNTDAQMEKLVEIYCQRKSLDVISVVFLYRGVYLRSKQTPDELGMKDGDKIYAVYDLGLSKRNKPSAEFQEGSRRERRVKVESEMLEDNVGTYSSELDRATSSFLKATSILRAPFLESNRLKEDARKCMKEVQSMTQYLDDILNAKMAAEKKVADRDLIIARMNKDLQHANAEISTLSAEKSRLSAELSKVEQKLVEANKEVLEVHKEVLKVRKEAEDSKLSVAIAEPQNKRKRAHVNASVKIEPSAVVESCTVDADADESERSVGKEQKKLAHVDGCKRSIGKERKKPADVDRCKRSIGKEQKKPANDFSYIYLKFIDGTGSSSFFKILRSAQMVKVLEAYCSQEGKDLSAMVFKFKNARFRKDLSPDELQMVNGDVIRVEPKRMRHT